MVLEAHLTLVLPPPAEAALRAFLVTHALRLTHLELSRGASPRQTMITGRLPGSPDDALLRTRALAAELLPLGIAVTRTKLEVEHAAEAGEAGAPVPALYLEHHVKVRAPPEALLALAQLGKAHGAHVSRNPFRAAVEGVEERFLTQRFSPQATGEAAVGLEALLAALAQRGVAVARITRERVVFDDNLSLDAGWHESISPR